MKKPIHIHRQLVVQASSESVYNVGFSLDTVLINSCYCLVMCAT